MKKTNHTTDKNGADLSVDGEGRKGAEATGPQASEHAHIPNMP